MRIHGQPRNPEGISEHHQCGLATNTGQAGQFLDRARDLALKICHQLLPDAQKVTRLGALKAQRPQDALQVRTLRSRIICRLGVAGKEFRGHRIHAFIRALCGKNGGNEQLQRGVIIQGTPCIRIFLRQTPIYFRCA